MKKILLLLTLGFVAAAHGQTPTLVAITNTPRTYFEAFNLTVDSVLVKGSSTIAVLNNQVSYPVEIRAERITNPQSTNSVYAISLRTTYPQFVQVDYVDYDELDPLIRSVQYISQANSAITPMDNFEAVFRTRSGVSLAKVGRGNKVVIALTSGNTNIIRNQMAAFVLDEFGRDLTAAKSKIDEVIASGQ